MMSVTENHLNAFQGLVESVFVERLKSFLLSTIPDRMLKIPMGQRLVADLNNHEMDIMIGAAIRRAKTYGLTGEQSIVLFTSLMFLVSPNFDCEEPFRMTLLDDSLPQDKKMELVCNQFDDSSFESAQKNYDIQAWMLQQ